MPPRVFGAVVRDIADEARRLDTIKIRNERHSNDPLADDFLSTLFAPAEACRVYALPERADWRRLAAALRGLVRRALDVHWGHLRTIDRHVYSWRLADVVQRCDYPAWAHYAARDLLRKGGSIFQHAGSAGPDTGVLLYVARSWTAHARAGGQGQRDTDPLVFERDERLVNARVLAGLAIREAVLSARQLVEAVRRVDEQGPIRRWRCFVARYEGADASTIPYEDAVALIEAQDELEREIERAVLDEFFPLLEYITEHRIHAEQLLLLAGVVAAGGISGKEAERVSVSLERERAERMNAEAALSVADEREAKRTARKKAESDARVRKMRAGRLKVTPEVASAIRGRFDELMKENPGMLVKTRHAEVARYVNEKFGLSDNQAIAIRTVQRKLARKD